MPGPGTASVSIFLPLDSFTTTDPMALLSASNEPTTAITFSIYALVNDPYYVTTGDGSFGGGGVGGFTVFYDYTPIPEPASLSIFAGLLLLMSSRLGRAKT